MHMPKTVRILIATVLICSGCAFTAAQADNAAAVAPHNHTQQVQTVAFGADSNTLVSAGDDSIIRIWDLEAGAVAAMLPGHKVIVSQLAAFEGRLKFASAAWDGTAGIWDISNRRLIRTFSAVDAAHDSLYAVAISHDGKFAATGGNNKTITLWNIDSGKPLRRWVLLTDKDEEEVSFGSSLDSNAITVREIAVDDQTRKWKFRDPVISALAFSPDGSTLAIGTGRGNILLQSLNADEPVVAITADGSRRVNFLAFSADGATVFISGAALQAYNAADGKLVRRFDTASAPSAAAISSDSATLAAATGRVVILFDAATGRETGRIERVQNVQALAFSPDGSRIAAGIGAGITVYDVNEGNAIVSLPPADAAGLRATHRASAPLRDNAFLADAFAERERRNWTLELETDALRWADESDSGVYFNACGLAKHMAAQDVFHRPWNPGTRSFDIVWRVRMDAGRPGNQFIQEGVCMGISSAPPLQMNEDDLAFFIAIHFNGISLDAARGEPYIAGSNYGSTRMRRLSGLMPTSARAEVPVIRWSHEALAALGTGNQLHIGMRREADDTLTFTVWCPDSGQNQSNPWWTGSWKLPDELAGIELNTLFIKRLPPVSTHMGQQGSGRDDMEMYGTITGLQAALQPPAITGIEWDVPVLGAGETLTVRGSSFRTGMTAYIDGVPSPRVNVVSSNELQVRLPELPESGYYTLTVSDRNGVGASMPFLYGRILDSVWPMESPAGGGIVTLTGAGFDDDVEVFFGDKPAEIVEIVDRNTARVLVPAGETGRTTVSARAGGATFAGTLSFGYVERPALFIGEMALQALRAKFADPAYGIYRKALEVPFEAALKDPATIAWACVYEGNDAQVQALVDWFASLDHPPQPDRYDNRLERSGLLAIAFDAVSDRLEPPQRGQMLEHLYRSLDTYVAYARNRVWNLRNVSSINPSSNLAGVLLALVLKDIHPDAAEAIEHALFELEYYITATWTEHGDCIDGADFGLQGLSDYILAANMLANATGERTLLEQQPLQNVHRLYETLAASPRGFMRFRTMSTTRLRGVSVCAYIGTRFNNPLMLWLADHLVVNGADGAAGVAQALAFRGRQTAPAECPPLPTLSVLPKVNWASMRSDATLQPELIVGVKGFNGPLNHWRHNSVGSFLLHAHGEELLLHPARFMWWGQAREAGNQNLPLIDGRGPDDSGGFITDSFEAENIRAVVIDATPAYKPFANAQRVRRHFVMLGNDTLIVLDDIVPAAGSAGRVRCQFQAIKAVLNPEGNEILVTGEKARLSIRMFGPDATLGSSSRRVEHHQNVWTTAWAEYNASAADPLVFVINTAGAEAPAIAQPSVRREGDVITVTVGEWQAIFRNSTGGWALERPDGGEPLLTLREEEPTRVARAIRADVPPVIDGNLDDALWDNTPPASGFRQPNTWYLPVVHDTEMRFAYDDENLYVAIRCFADNLDTLRTDAQYPLHVFETDDHVRMFIDVGNWKSHPRFFDRTITASGLVSQRRFGDMGYGEVHTAVGREGNAWTIEMSIPWSTLTENIWTHAQMPKPEPGTRMGLHLLRVNSDREYSEWIYRSHWTHGATRHWGKLIFE